jgi:putative resolvase
MSQLRHCDDGPTLVKSPPSEPLAANDSTPLQMCRVFGDNQQTKQTTKKVKVCYARVSSEHQRGDLERQIADLQRHFPDHEIISDIGSGLNWKRRGFTALLERIYSGGVEEVVVTRKDRLCRFGSELVEWIFAKSGTQLMVLGSDVSADSSEVSELAEDLLSITTVFVARHNGLRSAANRKRRRETIKEAQNLNERRESSGRQSATYPPLPYPQKAPEAQEMDGDRAVDLQPMPFRDRKRGREKVQERSASTLSQRRKLRM